MSNTSFTCTLYRLKTGDNSIEGSKANAEIDGILNYDFKKAKDESQGGIPANISPYYWREIFSKEDEEYYSFYKRTIDGLLSKINNTDFSVDVVDLTPNFLGYTLSLSINSLTDATSLEFKQSDIIFKENDLIEIIEVGSEGGINVSGSNVPKQQVIFLGFVTKQIDTLSYEGFYTQKLTLINIGKMYSLSKITTDPSLADVSIKGEDYKSLNIPVFTDVYNNKNTFDILESLMTNYFMAQPQVDGGSKLVDIKYKFNQAKLSHMDTFNIIFPILKTLQLYEKEKQKIDSQYVFNLCSIKNGKHKTYNEMIKSSFQLFQPQFKTVNQIISDMASHAMYDAFIDYNGTLIIRPPLYNYLPMGFAGQKGSTYDSAISDNAVYDPLQQDVSRKFKIDSDFVIGRNSIMDYNFVEDNTRIEVRTDAHFTWPYYGTSSGLTRAQMYEDIQALIKFGFRNEATRDNPNACSNKAARLLAMIYNCITNHGSRALNINVKTDKPITELKYQLGRLYYIDLPDITITESSLNKNTGNVTETKILEQQIQSTKNGVSPYGVVGYLEKIEKSYKYGEYILYNLTFNYIRDIDIINLKEYQGDSVVNPITGLENVNMNSHFGKLLYEIYNIVYPYGLLEELQLPEYSNIVDDKSKNNIEFNKFKQNTLDNFWNQLKQAGYDTNIPIFKLMPSVLNITELTYSDSETKNSISKILSTETNTNPTDVFVDEKGYLYYESYKFKLQRFFKYSSKEGMMQFTSNMSNQNTLDISTIQDILSPGTENTKENINKGKSDEDQMKSLEESFYPVVKKGDPNYPVISNYQNYNGFNFVLDSPSSSGGKVGAINNKNIKRNNIMPTRVKTMFRAITKTDKEIGKISQKLFNRIIEMDQELNEKYKLCYCEDMFYTPELTWKSSPTNIEVFTSNVVHDAISPLFGGSDVAVSYLGSSPKIRDVFSTLDRKDLWTTTNIMSDERVWFKAKNMPIGAWVIISNANTITPKNQLSGDHYLTIKEQDSGKLGKYIFNEDQLFFSPAFIFNLQTILENNTMMILGTQEELNMLKKKGINETAESIKAHKEGRAIDFILPTNETRLRIKGVDVDRMPHPYFGMLGNYKIKDTVYEDFDNMLAKYFDKVEKTYSTINIDMNIAKGITVDPNSKTSVKDIQSYGVYVYHIEVNSPVTWLNAFSEVLAQNHARVITTNTADVITLIP